MDTCKKTSYQVLLLFITTFLFFSPISDLQAQWSTDPNNNLILGYGLDPHICSDSAGGAYITYDYQNTTYPRWLALERLDRYGYKPWGTNKRILGELPEQSEAQIIEDGETGVIVSYIDNEWIPPNYFNSKVRVQKVDSNGNFLWGQTGVRVTIDETNHSGQQLVSDGDGGCVIVWIDWEGEFSMNRINGLGERVWGDSGIVLPSIGTSLGLIRASDDNYYVKISSNLYRVNQAGVIIRNDSVAVGDIVADPEGGLVLSGRVWTGMIPKLVAQRKDSLGNNLWQEPFVEIADSLGLGSFRTGINNRIINYAWLGTYNGQTDRPCFQTVNLEGNLIHQNKILLSENPSGTTLIGIISSYYSNTIFSWSISGEINSIFAQMYDTLGNKIWSENGIIVSHPRMTYQQYITDGRGGFIVAGLINNFTVVAQQVSKNGYLGEIITNVNDDDDDLTNPMFSLSQNYPNPFNSNCTIQYSVPSDGSIVMELFNTLGERVKTIVKKFQNKGTYTVEILSDELTSGIYIYRLRTDTKSLTKKLIILK